MESLSAYTRQFLDQMNGRRWIGWRAFRLGSRSTEQKTSLAPVDRGTITEIYEYLRMVYSTIGTPHCPNYGKDMATQ